MSLKQLNNLYTESVANREYQRNKETLLLELTLNEKTVKAVIDKYLHFEFTLNAKDPEQAQLLTNPYRFNKFMYEFCKERSIFFIPENIKDNSDEERIPSRKLRTAIRRDFTYLVGEIQWRELKPKNEQLAQYLMDFNKLVPGIWGAVDEEGEPYLFSSQMARALTQMRRSYLSLWQFLPWQDRTEKNLFRVKIQFTVSDLLAPALIEVFNKRQQILPNKDIFAYPNLFELCKALATTRSKAELNKVGADIENSIKEIKAAIIPNPNPNWIVIKPPNHTFSRKYFGISRYSIKDILKIADRAEKDPTNRAQILNEIGTMHKTKGASWCTSANASTLWDTYTKGNGNELYYFISMQSTPTEELFAIRTIGSAAKLAKHNGPLDDSTAKNVAQLLNAATDKKKGKFWYQMTVMPKGVTMSGKHAWEHGSWAQLTTRDNSTALLNYLYYEMFEHYAAFAIIETRNQTNENAGNEFDVVETFGEEWLKRNINFITGIPSVSSKQEAAKIALQICMNKKRNIEKESDLI